MHGRLILCSNNNERNQIIIASKSVYNLDNNIPSKKNFNTKNMHQVYKI